MQIYAPNPAFAGKAAGITFTSGRATVDPRELPAASLAYFRRHGYSIVEDRPAKRSSRPDDAQPGVQVAPGIQGDATPIPPAAEVPSRSASKAIWVAYATEHGLDAQAAEAMSRNELADRFNPKAPDA